MIKFFRHIRQRMLTENRFSRYFLYAVGEIVLVVIGILIALQINTWNEESKNARLEAEYYCRLLEDLQQDVDQTDALINQAEARLKASNQAVRLLQKERTNRFRLGEQISESNKAIYIDFKPNNSTFVDLQSANLNLIKDKSIIKALNNYYNKVESLRSIIMINGKHGVEVAFGHDDGSATGETQASLLNGKLRAGLEKDVYASIPVDTSSVIDSAMRDRLFNEALVYVSSNTRQLELYNMLKEHTASTVSLLQTKCQAHD